MKFLIKYFIEHPKMGNILMMLIFVFGFIGFKSINSATDPKIDPGLIAINVVYPGASPVEVEQSIILKIENALQGIQGVRKVTSTSMEDSGNIQVKVEEKFDTDQILLKVKNAIDGINTFPAGMEKVLVNREEFALEALIITLTGDVSLHKLLQEARVVEDDLLRLEGVSNISFEGLPQPEVEISLKEKEMRRYQLSFDEVSSKIREANLDLTGGTIRGKSELLMIRTKQKKYFAKDLEHIVIRNTRDGGIVYLKDIASLNESWKEVPNASYIDGDPSVSLKILSNEHEDVVEASETVRAYIDRYNHRNTESRLFVLFNKSEEISSMKSILASNGIQGFMLVILFLSLFLNARLSLWVALGIPISLLGMFIIAGLVGITFNTVSAFGMILVLGILVDDAVVVAESIYNHYLQGKTAINAAIDGSMEVLPAVFSGVLTTIIAFTVFFYIEGMLGTFFAEMAVVIIGALAFSLFEGFFILPAHVAESKALNNGNSISKFEKFFTQKFNKLRDDWFIPLLHFCLRNQVLTLSVLIGFLLLTMGAMNAGIIRQGDVEASDPISFTVELEMPPGTPSSVTQEYLQRIENGARKVGMEYDKRRNDTLKTIRFIALNINSDNSGNIRGVLQPAELRNYRSQEFVTDVRKLIGDIPEAQKVNYVQQSFWGKPISIELISRSIASLDSASLILETELRKIEDLKNVINNKKIGVREIEITLKPKAHALGITLGELMNRVRNGFYGSEAMRFSRGKEDVRIMVRYPLEERASISKFENMRMQFSDGSQYPLNEIADFKYKRNLVEIAHFNGKRSLRIEADIKNSEVNLNFIKKDIEKNILPKINRQYPDVSFSQSGMDEEMATSMKSVQKSGPIFLILLLVVILFTFRSKMQTFLVFVLVPFSFVGVAWGHAIHGKSIGMASMLGMIALLGVMVNNAIIFIDTYNKNLKKNMSVYDAVIAAAQSRFRPIILTTLTTVSGLFPLIFSNASVADIVVPMAITVAYGLIMATVLSLIMLPLIIIVANKLRYYFNWMVDFEKPKSFEHIEPACREIKVKSE
jgi:multidrug efflux pump subunit AcrB